MTGDNGLLGNRRRRPTPQAACAVLMAASVLGGLYLALHWVQDHLRHYPFLVILFPPLAMASIAVVIPLFMFVSYQDDFKNMTPLNPRHFILISKRCYSALAKNNMKVTEKDL